MDATSARFAVGDHVRVIGSNAAGRIVSIGDVETWLSDGDRETADVDRGVAIVEITQGPGAGEPWGYGYCYLDEIEHINRRRGAAPSRC